MACTHSFSPALLSRRLLLRQALAGMALGAMGKAGAGQQALRFGILPLGEALESRQYWSPLLDHLSQVLGQSISLLSTGSYQALGQAIERGEVDMAFLSGKMAVDAVAQHDMQVLAQVVRHDGLPGYRAILLALEGGPIRSLEDVLNWPERWRLVRGAPQSMSGYIVPHLQLFFAAWHPHGNALCQRNGGHAPGGGPGRGQ